jgi:hypothetical protein
MADSAFFPAGPRPLTASLQRPVDGRRYTQLGSVLTPLATANVGSCTRVVFDRACEIDDLAIYLAATYTAATTYTYRLGVYRDNGSNEPGALAKDAGTLTIAQNATAGFKSIALTGGDVVSVEAGETVWLVCAATHGGTVPSLTHVASHIQPYSDYGLSSATHNVAACFGYTTAPATALPSTFSFTSPETQPVGVAVYVKVNV